MDGELIPLDPQVQAALDALRTEIGMLRGQLAESDAQRSLLEAQVQEDAGTIDRWRLNGMQVVDTASLSRHPVQYITAAPTDTPADGSLRVARIAGVTYVYARAVGAWFRAVAAP